MRVRLNSPVPHPKIIIPLAVIIGVLMGLLLASRVTGYPAALWGDKDKGTHSQQQSNTQKQLADAGYKKVKDEKLPHEGLKRDVTTEWWERVEEPQQVVLSDDSSDAIAGRLTVNAVNFRGTDGKGNLSCQPDAKHSTANLNDILNDANEVRAGIADGSLKPKRTSAGFPYGGKLVGCLP